MPIRSTGLSCAALAFAAGALISGGAFAHEEENAPEPGSPLEGQPDTEGAKALAPIAPPPLVTPADQLPIDKIKVPDGFEVEVFASGVKDARVLRVGESGTVFISNWQNNKVWAKPEGGEPKVIYEGLDWPNGIALHDGDLYIAEHTRIVKAEDIEANLDNPPELVELYDDLGEPRPHGWRFVDIGPDDKLYVSNSSPCNICMPDEGFGEIRKMNLDGSEAEAIVHGVRNTVGFDWNPANQQLYWTDNNRDWFSEDLPNGELNRVTSEGEHFGFPYCHQGDILDPQFGWGKDCDDYTPPIAKLGPHVAPLGMRFYEGEMFPEKYQGAIFIARHGSWNRTEKIAADVVAVFLDETGDFKSMEPFLTGLIEDNEYIGRPVDVTVMDDGSLLVSDDWNGAVYRVTYGG